MSPHQMLQPQPTRQKITVNNCAAPTITFTIKDPMRP
jgi:hypothetical protein